MVKMVKNARASSPIKWLGSKRRIAQKIVRMIPPHEIYVEPFLGSGSVFFQKTPSKVEVINDVNDLLVNFFKVIKENMDEFLSKIDDAFHSRSLFNEYRMTDWKALDDPIEKAFRFYYLIKSAWNGLYRTNKEGKFNAPFGGSCNTPRDGGIRSLARQFLDTTVIEKARRRLQRATIDCLDYKEVVKTHDSKHTFFFFDPPYDTDYTYGTGKFDYEGLKNVLLGIKGKWILTLNCELEGEFSEFPIKKVKVAKRMDKMDRSEYLQDIIVKSPNIHQKTTLLFDFLSP